MNAINLSKNSRFPFSSQLNKKVASVDVIIWSMWSCMVCPKVITLIGFHCSRKRHLSVRRLEKWGIRHTCSQKIFPVAPNDLASVSLGMELNEVWPHCHSQFVCCELHLRICRVLSEIKKRHCCSFYQWGGWNLGKGKCFNMNVLPFTCWLFGGGLESLLAEKSCIGDLWKWSRIIIIMYISNP